MRQEISAVRGLFQFALDMGAADVMFNPAKNVKVPKTKSVQTGPSSPLLSSPDRLPL